MLFTSINECFSFFNRRRRLEEKLIISADNLFSANSNDNFVLVEFSKNKLTILHLLM